MTAKFIPGINERGYAIALLRIPIHGSHVVGAVAKQMDHDWFRLSAPGKKIPSTLFPGEVLYIAPAEVRLIRFWSKKRYLRLFPLMRDWERAGGHFKDLLNEKETEIISIKCESPEDEDDDGFGDIPEVPPEQPEPELPNEPDVIPEEPKVGSHGDDFWRDRGYA